MFVNFAKEQTDDDPLTDVVVSNGSVQTNLAALPVHISPPTIHPQPSAKPPEPSKASQSGTSSGSKLNEGTSKKTKSKKGKCEDGGARGENISSTEMNRIPELEEEEKPQTSRRVSGGTDSSNSESCNVSKCPNVSKERGVSSRNDPAALFIVSGSTQDSSL